MERPSLRLGLQVLAVLAALLGILLALLQPSLILLAVIGAAFGALVAVLLAYRPTVREGAGGRTRQGRGIVVIAIASLLVLGAVVAVIATLGGGEGSPRPAMPTEALPGGDEGPGEAEPPAEDEGAGREAEILSLRRQSVRPIDYAAVIAYNTGRGGWETEEIVRVARNRLERMTIGGSARWATGGVKLRDRVLGRQWHYLGNRGSSGEIYAYRRQRQLSVDVPVWPPTGPNKIKIGAIAGPQLAVTLVPRDGSTVELRAPENFVKEVDPAAGERDFGAEDIFTIRLQGLEDNVQRRWIHLRIANGIARSSIYEALDLITAWALIKLLFGSVPAIAVGFLLTKVLKRRFPERVQPS